VSDGLETIGRAVLIGIGATVGMDFWAVFLNRLFGVPTLNLAMVGRWLGHFPRGRFVPDPVIRPSALGRWLSVRFWAFSPAPYINLGDVA